MNNYGFAFAHGGSRAVESAAPRPAVSVVIPCFNESGSIERCVRSILEQAPDGGLEVIVSDGLSSDGTRIILDRLCAEFPELRVVENPGQIVSTGLNAAIRAARGAVILRADAHTEYRPGYIRECLRVLQETGADNVGGPWIADGKGWVGRAIAAAFQSPFAVGGARGHDPEYAGQVDTVYLGCWNRDVFERFGMFDEELVRNQDDEFNLRLSRGGALIWQSPSIQSVYRPRASLKKLARQYKQYGYWKVRVIQKHKLPASVRHLVPGVFVFLLLLLPVLSVLWPSAIWSWLAVAGAYFLFLVLASLTTAVRQGWDLVVLLPVVFACYHLGYGYGFLRGLWDFWVFRRAPAQTFTELTRG